MTKTITQIKEENKDRNAEIIAERREIYAKIREAKALRARLEEHRARIFDEDSAFSYGVDTAEMVLKALDVSIESIENEIYGLNLELDNLDDELV